MSTITINKIEALFGLVIEKLRKEKLESMQFDSDEYWIILTKEWNDFNVSPVAAVGSLVDDIDCLNKSIDNGEIFTYSDFDRIATVLRAISEQQASSD